MLHSDQAMHQVPLSEEYLYAIRSNTKKCVSFLSLFYILFLGTT